MKYKIKINYEIFIPAISLIYVMIYGLFNAENIGSCILTKNDILWQCNLTIWLIIYFLCMSIIIGFMFFELISICFEKGDE